MQKLINFVETVVERSRDDLVIVTLIFNRFQQETKTLDHGSDHYLFLRKNVPGVVLITINKSLDSSCIMQRFKIYME